MKDNLIPKEQLEKFPYLYKFLKNPIRNESSNSVEKMNFIIGKISSIQNSHSKLDTFYKSISRF